MRNENEIFENLERYSNLLQKLFDASCVEALIDHYGERLALCPFGLTNDDGGSPGDLVSFQLRQSTLAKRIVAKAELDLPVRSLVRCAAVSDLGRLGDLADGTELYIPQTSDWHREKLGQNYKYNENCSKSSVAHRTLFIMQHFGFKLEQEEWIAVLTSGGMHLPENAFYGNKKNDLVDAIQLVRHLAMKNPNKEQQ